MFVAVNSWLDYACYAIAELALIKIQKECFSQIDLRNPRLTPFSSVCVHIAGMLMIPLKIFFHQPLRVSTCCSTSYILSIASTSRRNSRANSCKVKMKLIKGWNKFTKCQRPRETYNSQVNQEDVLIIIPCVC